MEELPVGFRFRPTALGLLGYLRAKLEGQPVACGDAIREADVYNCHPQIIMERYTPPGDTGCYVFSPTKRRYGDMADRSNGPGKWKTTTQERTICLTNQDGKEVVLGHKNAMTYIDSNAKKTCWLMDEYLIKELRDCGNVGGKRKRGAKEGTEVLDRWVICYVHLSPGKGSSHDPVDPDDGADVGILPGEEGAPHDLQTRLPALDDTPQLAPLALPQPEVQQLPQLGTQFHGEDRMGSSEELLVLQHSQHIGGHIAGGAIRLTPVFMEDNQPSGFGCLQEAQEQSTADVPLAHRGHQAMQPLATIHKDQTTALVPLPLPGHEALPPIVDYQDPNSWLYLGDAWLTDQLEPQGASALPGFPIDLITPSTGSPFLGEDDDISSLLQPSVPPALDMGETPAGVMPSDSVFMEDNQLFGYLQDAMAGGEEGSLMPSVDTSVRLASHPIFTSRGLRSMGMGM